MASTWARAEELFQKAVKLAPGEREELFHRLEAEDRALAEEVRSLIEAEAHAPELFGDWVEGEIARGDAEISSVGPYRLLRRLGEGGSSAVYLARRDDGQFRKEVAIKLVRAAPGNVDLQRRCAAERQILAALDHPNIARLLDAGTSDDGRPYFVLEYVDGLPIDTYCARAGLSIAERIELFLDVCSAVGFAHRNLVVHRDLKPSNLLVTAEGTPKLLDFGIAKILEPALFPYTVAHTATGQRPMTPPYASPEQVRGEHITTASDVYSLGVLLYQLLVGRLPYRPSGDRPEELERLICEAEPELPSAAAGRDAGAVHGTHPRDVARRLKGDLDNVLLVALRKEPRRRYGSVDRLADDLRRHLDGRPVAARRDTPAYRAFKFLRRHRLGVAITATFVLLVVGFAVAMAFQARRLARQRDMAQLERDKAQQVAAFVREVFTLADPLEGQGSQVTATEILDRAAERIDRELVGQPLLQANVQVVTGEAFFGLGEYAKAEQLFRAALGIMRRRLAAGDPDRLDGLNGLAESLIQRGRYDEAEVLTREALESGRRQLGEEHPQVARTLNNLAELVEYKGDLGAAEDYYRRALAIQRAVLGEDAPIVALTLNNLAVNLQGAEKWQLAEEAYGEAISIQRRRLGPAHPHLGRSLHNLAVLLRQTGRPEESERLHLEALAMRRETLGESHPEVAVSLHNLASLLDFEGRTQEAEALYRQALEAHRTALGSDHPESLRLLCNLAAMLRDQKRYAEAEERYREALEISRRTGREEELGGIVSLFGLGSVLAEAGDPEAAEELLRRGLAGFRKLLPAGHRNLLWIEAIYGSCLSALGRYAEAEPLLTAGLPDLLASPAVPERRKEWLLDRAGELYRSWGRPEKAAEIETIRRASGTHLAPADPPPGGLRALTDER